MDQQGWSVLEDVIMIGLDKVKNFAMWDFRCKSDDSSSPLAQGILVFLQSDGSRIIFPLE
jgi:hypothetical protein